MLTQKEREAVVHDLQGYRRERAESVRGMRFEAEWACSFCRRARKLGAAAEEWRGLMSLRDHCIFRCYGHMIDAGWMLDTIRRLENDLGIGKKEENHHAQSTD